MQFMSYAGTKMGEQGWAVARMEDNRDWGVWEWVDEMKMEKHQGVEAWVG